MYGQGKHTPLHPSPPILLPTLSPSYTQAPTDPPPFLQGATYDAVEGRFRVFRKEAAKLQQEISNGDRPAAPRRGTSTSTPTTAASSFADSSFADSETSTPKKKAKTATPRKNTNGKGVLTGRVVKNMSNANNPVKKEKGGKGVKTEEEEEGEMDAVGGVAEGLLDEVFGVGALEV